MVKQTLKVITKSIALLASASLVLLEANTVSAVTQVNASFQVNVKETLSVSITRPSSGASGDVDEFLRNDFAINVISNSPAGFTASMYADVVGNTVPLTNTTLTSETLPTLTNSSGIERSSFPANYWGYSLGQYTLDGTVQNSYTLSGKTYSETAGGNDSSKYYPMINTSASPIIIMDGATSPKSTGTQNIYFGAKGDSSTASGTYTGTVIVSVVTGTIDVNTNPTTPTNPDEPSDDTANDGAATYTGSTGTGATKGVGSSGTSGTTIYTTTSGDTTTTEISGGDNRSAYANPQGERYETFSNVVEGSMPITGLVMASSVAAFTGFTFFIFAYRDDDDDDDDEEENGVVKQLALKLHFKLRVSRYYDIIFA